MHRNPFRLIWSALFILLYATAALAQPKISVDKTEVQFGMMYNGSAKEMSFKVTNKGKDTLQIYEVDVSCGCTNVTHPKTALAPGESQALTILFNASGYTGLTKKAVDIKTNDPSNPNQRVVLVADVREELQLAEKPKSIWLGEFKAGEQIKRDVTFINISNHPILLTGWNTSSRVLNVEFPKKVTDPKQRIVVNLSAEFGHEGLYTEYVYLKTDSPGQSTVPFSVSYSVVGQ
ncbi:MAG: DUF1573 domain-containing protein [Chlorobiales bacterium]|jgi:hypothetical protein|nr:DUF1573 domain-containing protein [Chlorobiales bacterium]